MKQIEIHAAIKVDDDVNPADIQMELNEKGQVVVTTEKDIPFESVSLFHCTDIEKPNVIALYFTHEDFNHRAEALEEEMGVLGHSFFDESKIPIALKKFEEDMALSGSRTFNLFTIDMYLLRYCRF